MGRRSTITNSEKRYPQLLLLAISSSIVLFAASARAEAGHSPMFIPGARLALGAGVHPGHNEAGEFDLDLALSAAITSEGDFMVGVVTELGYAYHAGDEVGGHYGTVMLGVSMMHVEVIGWTLFTTLMLGEREDTFDIGLRAGLRLELLWGIFSPECAYEIRTGDAGTIHSTHIVLSLDVLRVFVVLAFGEMVR